MAVNRQLLWQHGQYRSDTGSVHVAPAMQWPKPTSLCEVGPAVMVL
jgi:hypothetical protein